MAEVYGRMMVWYSAIWICGAPVDYKGDRSPSLIGGVDDFVTIKALANDVYAGVRVVTSETALPVDNQEQWDRVEQRPVTFHAPPYLMVSLTEPGFLVDPALQDLGLPAGHYMLRCYSRGSVAAGRAYPYGAPPRDEQSDDPASFIQQFRIEFWPASPDTGAAIT
ncbi:hypothetical protein [Rhodococcus sp. KRD162]|jgi:hypothetical protein|uniref:hypothetical protein n=1 Tax=Rhodococcus sp. KRD162 TaxID=2729725 RepID=UPI0019D0CE70|nr:hypothetical protein [Rhodococcus sp. KRD162]